MRTLRTFLSLVPAGNKVGEVDSVGDSIPVGSLAVVIEYAKYAYCKIQSCATSGIVYLRNDLNSSDKTKTQIHLI